eukprot:m51a1_g12863 hypothetical protein (150) ;mRNA; f:116-700
MRYVRVVTATQPVTRDRRQAEADADVRVLGVNAAQQTAKIAQMGDYTYARVRNLEHRQLMERAARSNAEQAREVEMYKGFSESVEQSLLTAQRAEFSKGEALEEEGEADERKPAKTHGFLSFKRKARRDDQTSSTLWSAKHATSNTLYK